MSVTIRNVNLNLLKVFDAVMRERNITRAAERLCVSQPAISNALGSLRALYGDELFIRTPKGVAPTAKALEIADPIRESLKLVDGTLESDFEFRPESLHRQFTVALTDYGELHFLPYLISELNVTAPGVEVVCLPEPGATLTPEMRSGTVDLVWDWLRIDDPRFHVELAFEDRSYCVARTGHPKVNGGLSVDDFLELEHVALRPTRTHIPMIERELEKQGLERKVVTEVSHLLAMPGIVANTDLVACLPERLAKFYARQMDLAICPNPVFSHPVPVYQMWHKHLDDDAGHAWFRGLLQQLAHSV